MFEALVEWREAFGDDAHAADDRHEVRVAAPAWNDVDVNVVVNAGSRSASKIPADVEPVGMNGLIEQALGVDAKFPEIENFLLGDLGHFADFAIGDGHQMPGGVGVFVHDEEGCRSPRDDKVGGIVGRGSSHGEEISADLVFGLKIFDTPRGPERLDVILGECLVHRNLLCLRMGNEAMRF